MAGRRELKCVGPSAWLPDRKAACQRTINLYLSQVDSPGEDASTILESTPGLVSTIDFGAPIRGAFSNQERSWVVAGTTLYETTNGTAVARGEIGGNGPVSMEDGMDQLVIVTGTSGYVMRMSTNIVGKITDPDWRGSYDVAELNGLFIFIALDGSDQFYLSAIDDATNLDALDFSTADAQPDTLLTVRVTRQEAYMFGALSVEVWIFTGDADFPLTRYNSTPIDVGIVGRRAVIKAANTLVFVGRTERGTGVVYMMEGHQPKPISSQTVQAALQADGVDLSNCTMWVRQGVNCEFVGINAPGLGTTWVWNAVTGQWHEEAELVDGEWQPSRVQQVTNLGKAYAMAGTKQYEIRSDANTLDGDILARERTWPHLMAPTMEPVSYSSLELACTTGHGGQITLELSNDGGYTYGPPLARSLGATGRWMERVRWMPLGSSRNRVFRLRCTDPVPLNIHAANVEAY